MLKYFENRKNFRFLLRFEPKTEEIDMQFLFDLFSNNLQDKFPKKFVDVAQW